MRFKVIFEKFLRACYIFPVTSPVSQTFAHLALVFHEHNKHNAIGRNMLTVGFQCNFRLSISFTEPTGRLVSTKTQELRVLVLTKRNVGSRDCSALVALKGRSHEGACSRSTLPEKSSLVCTNKISSEKLCCATKLCSRVFLPLIKLV